MHLDEDLMGLYGRDIQAFHELVRLLLFLFVFGVRLDYQAMHLGGYRGHLGVGA